MKQTVDKYGVTFIVDSYYQYIAVDKNLDVYCYEEEPTLKDGEWCSNNFEFLKNIKDAYDYPDDFYKDSLEEITVDNDYIVF